MIRSFLRERMSWIGLFLFFQLFLLFVSYVDAAIPISSILYIIFLFTIIFVLFLFIRYQRETRFYRSLKEWEYNLDVHGMERANSPFERIAEESLKSQTTGLKAHAMKSQASLTAEKDELLSWIHEVKTPLTAMHLMIDRMKNEPLKKELTYEWLRIHLLLDQQLHQKRISAMENDLYIEKIQLEDLIFEEIKTLQSWCIQKGIGFDLDLKTEEVLSDAKWLSFIIRQLLTNAVKYSLYDDIVIKSGLQNGQAYLEISDQGRGISAHDLPRIFEKGFTSTAEHQNQAATGMGLYLAKKAADSLSIQIAVHSLAGKGSSFTLIFPVRNDFVRITSM
ncbi:sensor histidine kinase [Metabacillus sp. GX 13764]|uniref:sensor histidine kinase n=1 Tax=Metabacillus kandeliae TaxID=2900151 RepID=UPI001E3796DC|nr:sensor histidine kinase [Metabacillus kandeliae]MCD7035397.1 sensor histidine kinase [Metabacillus kandeliae]